MRILVENSSWNNIGDGFYQFSLFNLLRKEFPHHDYAYLDAPASRSFRYAKPFSKNVFKFEEHQDADLYIFSGPILGSDFLAIYAPLIKQIQARGGNYALVSVHGDAESANTILSFFSENPPLLLASRDRNTFDIYKNGKFPTYDGVCTASLVSITCDVGDTTPDTRYISTSFYDGYEPYFEIKLNEQGSISEISDISAWQPEPNWKFKRHFEYLFKSYRSNIADFQIVRPVHDIGYKFSHLNYSRSNSFLSYNPLTYLSLYKGTSLTVTNRLHAALPTLSFGKPAAYVGSTRRNGAIDRLGLRNYQGRVVRLDREVLTSEYTSLVQAIRGIGL